MKQIQLEGAFYVSWEGALPPRAKEHLKEAKDSLNGYTYHEVAFCENYPEGEAASNFDLTTGTRIVEAPAAEATEEELWKQELETLEIRCSELDQRSIRSIRAVDCKTDTASDRAFLAGIEADIQVKRARIRELETLLGGS